MPLFAADEDDSALDIVGGVQYGYNRSVRQIVERSDMTRHKRVVSKWTSSRKSSFLVVSLALKAETIFHQWDSPDTFYINITVAGPFDPLSPNLKSPFRHSA